MITRLVQRRCLQILSIMAREKFDSLRTGTTPSPWYEIFPLDFVTENLWPWEIRDERVVDLAMVPAGTIPAETVVSRAELARRSAGSGPPVPVAPVAVPPPSLLPGTTPASPNVLPQAPVEPLPSPTTGPVFPSP